MYGLHKGLFRSLCKATKFFEMVNKHHKDAFDRISEERRERILEVGTEEFSSKGYENANINVIAKNAGISIGLMYKYFATKEDLFITCIQRGMRILSQVIEEIMASDDKLLVKAEKLIRATCVHSKRNANYIRLYNEIASEKDSERTQMLVREIESETSGIYTTAIAQALAKGDVRPDLDAGGLVNLLLWLLKADLETHFDVPAILLHLRLLQGAVQVLHRRRCGGNGRGAGDRSTAEICGERIYI